MTFGSPSGSLRMPAVIIDVPPPPPMPTTPATSSRAGRNLAKASPMAAIAVPRSLPESTAAAPPDAPRPRFRRRCRPEPWADACRHRPKRAGRPLPQRRTQDKRVPPLRVGRANDVDTLHLSSPAALALLCLEKPPHAARFAGTCNNMRCAYRKDMDVSRQHSESSAPAERGPRARTRKLMLDTATRLMQSGITPR